MASISIPLWQLTRDPALIAFLQRGARDNGPEPVLAKAPLPRLAGGSAVRPAFDHCQEDDAFGILSTHIGRGERFAARVLEDA